MLLLAALQFSGLLYGPGPTEIPAGVSRIEDLAPDRRALLVGVGNYARAPGTESENLLGPANDVEMMRRLLVERFDFPAEGILVLTEEAATHAMVIRAFTDHLIRPARPGTEAVFYFAGHGSRAADQAAASSSERGSEDSTLVCWDGARSAEQRVPDITDDEIHSLLAALAERTTRITVITDCCHSGGNTRGAARSRALNPAPPLRPEDRERLWPSTLPFLEDGDPRRSAETPWVHIAAADFDGAAFEDEFKDAEGAKNYFGVLTWHLAESLREASPGATYEQIVEEAAASAAGQAVHAMGEVRRVLFDADFEPPPPGFPALLNAAGDTLQLRAGSLHLIHPESQFLILDGEREIGKATLMRNSLRPTSCAAVWAGKDVQVRGPRSLRAVPLGARAGRAPLAVFAPEGEIADALLAEAIQTGLARRVASSNDAEWIIEAVAEPGDWLLRDATADLVLSTLDPSGSTAKRSLFQAIEREQRWRRLQELAVSDSGGVLSLEMLALDSARLAELAAEHPGSLAAAEVDAATEQGVPVRLNASLQAVEVVLLRMGLEAGPGVLPMHVAVLCVSEDRTVELVFPTDLDRENVLEPGETRDLSVEVFLPTTWPADRHLRDRYIVIGTQQFVDFASLAQSGLVGARLRGESELPESVEAAFTGALRESAAGGARVRWSLARLDVLLKRP
jgi:hypothetical protein